ncbi:hypothetical protein [Halomarina oriensis]|uniref:Uncharacterized protein n=1 Tax=Halomarina oriensis TaxID=671145 RepID=A0A6B0GQ74_9EURY|nr:hypothetical protein [Halomarina oriensis]MWG36954.1 hypothetical protein [Halomarina oriensis]
MELGFDFEQALNAERRDRGLDPVDTDRDGTVDSGTDTLGGTVHDPTSEQNRTTTNETTTTTNTSNEMDYSDLYSYENDPRQAAENYDRDPTNNTTIGEGGTSLADLLGDNGLAGLPDGTGGTWVPGNGPTESTNPGGDDTVNDVDDVMQTANPFDARQDSGVLMAVIGVFLAILAFFVGGR